MALEIVGADEIIGDEYIGDDDGDDDDDMEVGDDDLEGMLGASPRRRRRRRMGMPARFRAAALAARAAAGASVVRSERPTESRALVIGFSSLAVAALASSTVTSRPQVLFRPTRLVVPSAVAPSFTIDDIKVGNKSQLIASGAIPAEAFAQTAFNTPLKLDTCQISMDLIVVVTNVTAAAADFRASMFGDAVY